MKQIMKDIQQEMSKNREIMGKKEKDPSESFNQLQE